MKVFRIVLLLVIASALIFNIGCAARKTVKPDKAEVTDDGAGMVDDYQEPETQPATKDVKKYIVREGDTLWGISTKDKIYSDPFQWPLLYKANRDMIEDPDLIYPDQEFLVKEDFSSTEVDDAVQKAKDTPPYRAHTSPRKSLPLRY